MVVVPLTRIQWPKPVNTWVASAAQTFVILASANLGSFRPNLQRPVGIPTADRSSFSPDLRSSEPVSSTSNLLSFLSVPPSFFNWLRVILDCYDKGGQGVSRNPQGCPQDFYLFPKIPFCVHRFSTGSPTGFGCSLVAPDVGVAVCLRFSSSVGQHVLIPSNLGPSHHHVMNLIWAIG